MDTVQLVELSSRECKRYISKGGDLALIPVGKTERLGPHLPLTGKNYVVSAICKIFAEKNNGYCLPVLPYADCKGLGKQPGSIKVDSDILYDYITDISEELVQNGFRRIIIVSYLPELYYITQEFFQEKDLALAWFSPERIPFEFTEDKDTRETSLIAASLKILNKEELLKRVLIENRNKKGQSKKSLADQLPLKELKKIGAVGCKYNDKEYPILPVEKIYLKEAIAAIESWADEMKTAVEALKEYNYFLARAKFTRGLR